MRGIRLVLGIAAVALGVALVSAMVTLLLLPFWSWIEMTAGIESVGHSGPAEWCFILVFGVMAAVVAAVLAFARKSGRGAAP